MDDLDGLPLLVIHTPGHCAGQVAFLWQREGGVLFVGHAAANTLGLRLSISYEDLALGKRTLAKLAALPFSAALFGHGRTITSGAAEKIWQRQTPVVGTEIVWPYTRLLARDALILLFDRNESLLAIRAIAWTNGYTTFRFGGWLLWYSR